MREKKYVKMMDLLVSKGANVNLKMEGTVDEDVSSLHIAAEAGNVARIKWLLGRGADVGATTSNGMVRRGEGGGGGRGGALRNLLPTSTSRLFRSACHAIQTPLHFAARAGKCEVATYLLKHDAFMGARNSISWTPLHFASAFGGTQMVKLLLMAGANKFASATDGRTPIDIARDYGNRSSFEALRVFVEESIEAKEHLQFLEFK